MWIGEFFNERPFGDACHQTLQQRRAAELSVVAFSELASGMFTARVVPRWFHVANISPGVAPIGGKL
jgi:hypothetical protein